MTDNERFDRECEENARRMAADGRLREQTLEWIVAASRHKYTYNFRWLGLPVIQFPQDMFALQELAWRVRPEAIVETGVARGGSLVFHASVLQLLGGDGVVVGIDVDIRPHNREAIAAHPLASRIRLVEGSSTDEATLVEVRRHLGGRTRVLVVLDSNHTHEHVSKELRAYAPLVAVGSYLVVMDTIVDDMPKSCFPDRPWGPGDNPKTATRAFLREHPEFEIDREIESKLLLTVAPEGFLRRVR